jgi:ATP-dependent helicase YprA (DUF1998 family)
LSFYLSLAYKVKSMYVFVYCIRNETALLMSDTTKRFSYTPAHHLSYKVKFLHPELTQEQRNELCAEFEARKDEFRDPRRPLVFINFSTIVHTLMREKGY